MNYLNYIRKYQAGTGEEGILPRFETRNGIMYMITKDNPYGLVVGEVPVSGKDPLLSLWVEGEALALPLKGLGFLGKFGWKELSKVAPKATSIVENGTKYLKLLTKRPFTNKWENALNSKDIDAFINGKKPMLLLGESEKLVSIDAVKNMQGILLLFVPFEEGGTRGVTLFINKDRLINTINAYKGIYTHRLGLPKESSALDIYTYILNHPQIFNSSFSKGLYLDLLGISLGYGPKDAIIGSNTYLGLTDWNVIPADEKTKYANKILEVYNGAESGWPYILSKRIKNGNVQRYHSTVNGGHVGYHLYKAGGKLNYLNYINNDNRRN